MAEVDLDRLRRVSVFSVLGKHELRTLADAAQVTEHADGEALTEEGGIGHRFHLILEGAVVVERGGREVARLGPGQFLGEIALLGGGRSIATARCTEPTRCLTLRREAFWEALEAEPRIALRILEVVAHRLEEQFGPRAEANLPE